ncbi:MAG: nucleotidyltransferase family protein [Acidocella sp.]|nr:nucleotidyltransferase family protein [Acidocella sp.]
MHPDTAVILGAGLGMRMRPLTLDCPKPLLMLAGQPILQHVLTRLRQSGVRRVIVNAHHLAGQMASFCAAQPDITLVTEPELRGTGGAVGAMAAQNLLPPTPFFILNGDSFWVDGPSDTLARLSRAFDPAREDTILLLARAAGAVADTGRGDFLWPRGEGLVRRRERDVAPYLFAGVQITTLAALAGAPAPPFSMNLLWDRSLAAGRLGAMVHDGVWFHLSTPDDLASAEAALAAREVGNST